MDIPALLTEMSTTLTEIQSTYAALSAAAPSHDQKLDELELRRDTTVRALLAAYAAESESLAQKRRQERDEIAAARRREDEERERRRREEDEALVERDRRQDEEREGRLRERTKGLEEEIDELMELVEEEARKDAQEAMGKLKGLEGRRKELNHMLEEKLQAPPLPVWETRTKKPRGELLPRALDLETVKALAAPPAVGVSRDAGLGSPGENVPGDAALPSPRGITTPRIEQFLDNAAVSAEKARAMPAVEEEEPYDEHSPKIPLSRVASRSDAPVFPGRQDATRAADDYFKTDMHSEDTQSEPEVDGQVEIHVIDVEAEQAMLFDEVGTTVRATDPSQVEADSDSDSLHPGEDAVGLRKLSSQTNAPGALPTLATAPGIQVTDDKRPDQVSEQSSDLEYLPGAAAGQFGEVDSSSETPPEPVPTPVNAADAKVSLTPAGVPLPTDILEQDDYYDSSDEESLNGDHPQPLTTISETPQEHERWPLPENGLHDSVPDIPGTLEDKVDGLPESSLATRLAAPATAKSTAEASVAHDEAGEDRRSLDEAREEQPIIYASPLPLHDPAEPRHAPSVLDSDTDTDSEHPVEPPAISISSLSAQSTAETSPSQDRAGAFGDESHEEVHRGRSPVPQDPPPHRDVATRVPSPGHDHDQAQIQRSASSDSVLDGYRERIDEVGLGIQQPTAMEAVVEAPAAANDSEGSHDARESPQAVAEPETTSSFPDTKADADEHLDKTGDGHPEGASPVPEKPAEELPTTNYGGEGYGDSDKEEDVHRGIAPLSVTEPATEPATDPATTPTHDTTDSDQGHDADVHRQVTAPSAAELVMERLSKTSDDDRDFQDSEEDREVVVEELKATVLSHVNKADIDIKDVEFERGRHVEEPHVDEHFVETPAEMSDAEDSDTSRDDEVVVEEIKAAAVTPASETDTGGRGVSTGSVLDNISEKINLGDVGADSYEEGETTVQELMARAHSQTDPDVNDVQFDHGGHAIESHVAEPSLEPPAVFGHAEHGAEDSDEETHAENAKATPPSPPGDAVAPDRIDDADGPAVNTLPTGSPTVEPLATSTSLSNSDSSGNSDNGRDVAETRNQVAPLSLTVDTSVEVRPEDDLTPSEDSDSLTTSPVIEIYSPATATMPKDLRSNSIDQSLVKSIDEELEEIVRSRSPAVNPAANEKAAGSGLSTHPLPAEARDFDDEIVGQHADAHPLDPEALHQQSISHSDLDEDEVNTGTVPAEGQAMSPALNHQGAQSREDLPTASPSNEEPTQPTLAASANPFSGDEKDRDLHDDDSDDDYEHMLHQDQDVNLSDHQQDLPSRPDIGLATMSTDGESQAFVTPLGTADFRSDQSVNKHRTLADELGNEDDEESDYFDEHDDYHHQDSDQSQYRAGEDHSMTVHGQESLFDYDSHSYGTGTANSVTDSHHNVQDQDLHEHGDVVMDKTAAEQSTPRIGDVATPTTAVGQPSAFLDRSPSHFDDETADEKDSDDDMVFATPLPAATPLSAEDDDEGNSNDGIDGPASLTAHVTPPSQQPAAHGSPGLDADATAQAPPLVQPAAVAASSALEQIHHRHEQDSEDELDDATPLSTGPVPPLHQAPTSGASSPDFHGAEDEHQGLMADRRNLERPETPVGQGHANMGRSPFPSPRSDEADADADPYAPRDITHVSWHERTTSEQSGSTISSAPPSPDRTHLDDNMAEPAIWQNPASLPRDMEGPMMGRSRGASVLTDSGLPSHAVEEKAPPLPTVSHLWHPQSRESLNAHAIDPEETAPARPAPAPPATTSVFQRMRNVFEQGVAPIRNGSVASSGASNRGSLYSADGNSRPASGSGLFGGYTVNQPPHVPPQSAAAKELATRKSPGFFGGMGIGQGRRVNGEEGEAHEGSALLGGEEER